MALLVVIVLAVVAAVLLLTSEHWGGQHAGQHERLYTCGMHPQVIQNKPGNCPICGMKLTPIRKQGGGPASNANLTTSTNASMSATAAEAAGIITIDPTTSQNMGLRTGPV